MEVSNDLNEMLAEETGAEWELTHDTKTVTKLENGNFEVTVAAWNSNELNRWSVSLRNNATDTFIPAEDPAYTNEVVETVETLVNEHME